MIPSYLESLDGLRKSPEPSIRYSIYHYIDELSPDAASMRDLQEEIRGSARAQSLLSQTEGIYNKWQGAHWVLSLLAELHYPPNDDSLHFLRDQVYDWLFSARFIRSIKTIKGKVRRCASQEGNAVYYSHALGIANERTDELVDRLLEFQWEDGGWNCDRNPEAHHSSYHESLIPLRALIIHSHKNQQALPSSQKKLIQNKISMAKELFLRRELFLASSTGLPIHPDFTLLHFPYYWRYNILFTLKVLNEGGFISDPRCTKALNLIESKELPNGGFAAEKKYYTVSTKASSGRSSVNWGGASKRKSNDWVTIEVLNVLKAADRL